MIFYTANPTNGTVPLTVQFTAPSVDSGGNNVTHWNWAFGDGTTSTAQNPLHTYTTTGAFSTSLIATNINRGHRSGYWTVHHSVARLWCCAERRF